ncbi:MAG TPA: NADH-quinone oxidoreductase subunit C [Bacteroidales bacterium]|nr:NADH-quinone oxidoreductase subunit C [Bacteroidales bacterium]
MDNNKLEEFIKSLIPETDVKIGKQYVEVTVTPASLHSTAKLLRDNEETRFDFLLCITGVDWGQDLGIIYHLRSTLFGHAIVLKTMVCDRINPVVDTISDLWNTADFHEREVYDLLGIKFANHPDLRRLFLDSSWGFPLRKDYVDDVNIVTK